MVNESCGIINHEVYTVSMDIPYLDLEDTLADSRLSLSKQASTALSQRQWAASGIVNDLPLWKAHIEQTNDPVFMQWAWLSTVWNAPTWDKMTMLNMRQWMPVWLHFLRMDDKSWLGVQDLENGRLESQWIRHLRDVLYAGNAQPLLDWWNGHQTLDVVPPNADFFWKSAYVTLAQSPDIAGTLYDAWLVELTRGVVNPGVLFEWSSLLSQRHPNPPKIFEDWLSSLVEDSDMAVRTLFFRQPYGDPSWTASLCREVMRGVSKQQLPHTALPSSIQTVWGMIKECDYVARLDIANVFLSAADVHACSERWPADYHSMERCILHADPNADLSRWGTAPWLAALLHILPEFANVLLFHDVLPVTPAQAHNLVVLYQDHCVEQRNPSLYPINSDLFETMDTYA